jgi:hypothetical protein
MRILLVAALLAASFAGCLGASGKPMTLRDGLGEAEGAARSWADGKEARLVGAAAVEPFKHLDHTKGGRHAEFVTHLDGAPGDGKAPGWMYGFVAGDRCIVVVLAAGLGVLAEGYETCDPADAKPLPAWSVDSDRVASILAGREDWPRPGDGTLYFWELSAKEERPVWSVNAQSADGGGATALVDAANGTVLLLEKHAMRQEAPRTLEAQAPVDTSHGTQSHSGSATVLRPGASLETQLQLDSAGMLEVRVSYQQAVGAVHVKVAGPAGELETTEVPVSLHKVYTGLPAGDYTLTVTCDTLAVLVETELAGTW